MYKCLDSVLMHTHVNDDAIKNYNCIGEKCFVTFTLLAFDHFEEVIRTLYDDLNKF